jgi:hypothetical protein
MSDTTSFLGGAALAGLAAMIVLRGGINFGTPGVATNPALLPLPPSNLPAPATGFSLPSPSPSAAPAIAAVPGNGERSIYEDAKLRLEVDQLKSQIEQQQNQIRSQQTLIDNLTFQAKAAGLNTPQPQVVPQAVPQMQSNGDNSLVSGLPWALGGVLLTFGGGIALVGMFSMLSRQNRPVRTVEYVHDDYPSYLPQRRRVQVLPPPRRTVRRVDLEDDD